VRGRRLGVVFELTGGGLLLDAAVVAPVRLFLLLGGVVLLLLVVLEVLQDYLAVFYQTALEDHVLLWLLVLNLAQVTLADLRLH
jgi:hypothetical protein